MFPPKDILNGFYCLMLLTEDVFIGKIKNGNGECFKETTTRRPKTSEI